MKELYKHLKNSGINCEYCQGNIEVNHFIKTNIKIRQDNDNIEIENGVTRYIFIALISVLLLFLVSHHMYGAGIVALIVVYSSLQAIRETIITSSLNVLVANFNGLKT